MFGELAVAYLFLGGAGAGCVLVASLLDLVVVREPFGTAEYAPGPAVRPAAHAVDVAFAVGFVAVAAGIACLLLDVGRIDRVASLFLDPHPTFMTFGSYALAALAVLAAALAVVRFAYVPGVSRAAVTAAEAVACVVAVAVMTYTGLLLQSVEGVRFWGTPLVTALFVLSSASSGVACVVIVMMLENADAQVRRIVRALAVADVALIVAEVACAAALIAQAAASDHEGVLASLETLTRGDLAPVWWGGFAACGLAVPLAAEAAFLARGGAGRTNHASADAGAMRTAVAVAAALVLVGAICLRVAIAGAGAHRELALEDPVAVYAETLADSGSDGAVTDGLAGAPAPTDKKEAAA